MPPYRSYRKKVGARRRGSPTPRLLNSKAMEDLEAVEAVARFLEDNAYPFTPKEIYRAVKRRGVHVEGDLKTFIREVQERGLAKTREVLEALWEFLDIPPLEGVEEWLREGASLKVLGPTPGALFQGLDVMIEMVWDDGSSHRILRKRFSGPQYQRFGHTYFEAKAGLETLRPFSSSYGVRGRAVLEASSPDHLEGDLERLRGLRPLLSAMGLSDLEGAAEGLLSLEKGESRIEGPYVLAQGKNPWNEDVWVLRREPIFGHPELDGALLTKGEATLRFGEDVEFSFEVWWRGWSSMCFERLRVRWGEEEVHFRYPHLFSANSLAKNPIAEAIQSELIEEIQKLEVRGKSDRFKDPPSPKMWAFLKAFAYHEDPFGALAEGKFLAHAKAELFLDL